MRSSFVSLSGDNANINFISIHVKKGWPLASFILLLGRRWQLQCWSCQWRRSLSMMSCITWLSAPARLLYMVGKSLPLWWFGWEMSSTVSSFQLLVSSWWQCLGRLERCGLAGGNMSDPQGRLWNSTVSSLLCSSCLQFQIQALSFLLYSHASALASWVLTLSSLKPR